MEVEEIDGTETQAFLLAQICARLDRRYHLMHPTNSLVEQLQEQQLIANEAVEQAVKDLRSLGLTAIADEIESRIAAIDDI